MSAIKEKRCSWCLGSELYIDYHDNEWGVPCYDATELFEMLNLEGAQAGLSWITILNKRENYRKAFASFDIAKVARFTPAKVDKLVLDAGIVRHRQKIEAFINNAKVVIAMDKEAKSVLSAADRKNYEAGAAFVDLVWSFVDYKTIQNKHRSMKTVPSSTEQSLQMSKALKKAGFKFVGSTTCYAFMQACGMVNDHMVTCPRYKQVASIAQKSKPPKRWPKH